MVVLLAGDAALGDGRPAFEREWKGVAAALFGLSAPLSSDVAAVGSRSSQRQTGISVTNHPLNLSHSGYLFNLIYDLSRARLGRGGRRVALISAVHGIRV